MANKKIYKKIEARRRDLLNFLHNQARKGHSMIQHKDLVSWARKEKMSKHTLQEILKFLTSWGFVIREVRPNGVFYGLSSSLRQWFSEEFKRLEIAVSEIHGLPEEKKKKQLKSLIGVTMLRFLEFVPFCIHHFLNNEQTIENLQDNLTGCFQYVLLPYLFETIKACIRDEKTVSEILPLEQMTTEYRDYLNSDFFKQVSS